VSMYVVYIDGDLCVLIRADNELSNHAYCDIYRCIHGDDVDCGQTTHLLVAFHLLIRLLQMHQ